jgi:2-dehydro-3-deoxygalactonokinase
MLPLQPMKEPKNGQHENAQAGTAWMNRNADRAFSIVGDWGTSHLRLFLVHDNRIIDQCDGPGLAAAIADPGDAFMRATAGWRADHGALPVLLAGTVGSNIGWREVPYRPCPIACDKLVDGAVHFRHEGHDLAIIPGLSCINPLGYADYMRGEETQILGALMSDPALKIGRQIICLPGTHSKWVILQDGVVERFFSSLTGEFYGIIKDHSVLLRGSGTDDGFHETAFIEGVKRICANKGAMLLNRLFEVRARQISRELTVGEAASFLSGLLIGADVDAALRILDWSHAGYDRVTIIATRHLSDLYALALDRYGVASQSLDGKQQSGTGLLAMAARLRDLERSVDVP